MIFGCSQSRGPTQCIRGSCYCQEGFCRYPASTVHVTSRYCVQRVPGSTCHATRVCYKGGLTTSFCEKGLCMCKWGYRLDEDGQCVPPGDLSLAGMGNFTGAAAEELAEIQRMENMAVSLNILLFCLYVTMAAMAMAGGAVLLRRRFRAPAAAAAEYKLLAA